MLGLAELILLLLLAIVGTINLIYFIVRRSGTHRADSGSVPIPSRHATG